MRRHAVSHPIQNIGEMVTGGTFAKSINRQQKVMRRPLKMIHHGAKREGTECWILCRMRRICLFGPTKRNASRSGVGVAVEVVRDSAQGPEALLNVREEHGALRGQNDLSKRAGKEQKSQLAKYTKAM